MIITRKDLKTTFEALRVGAVFEYDGQIFMKTSLRTEEKRAVILADGTMWAFDDSAFVAPLDAELIVRGVLNEDTSR